MIHSGVVALMADDYDAQYTLIKHREDDNQYHWATRMQQIRLMRKLKIQNSVLTGFQIPSERVCVCKSDL